MRNKTLTLSSSWVPSPWDPSHFQEKIEETTTFFLVLYRKLRYDVLSIPSEACLNYWVRTIMVLIGRTKAKKNCHNRSKKFLLSFLLNYLLLLISARWFSQNSEHNTLERRCQILEVVSARDLLAWTAFGLLNVLFDQVRYFWTISQETVASSYSFYYNILCKSNQHWLLKLQISSQMLVRHTNFL